MKKIIRLNESDIARIVKKVLNEQKWASDGGYYTERDTNVYVTREEAEFINKVIDAFKSDILNPEQGIVVDKSARGRINSKIINYLKKDGYDFSYETDEGTDFYYLSPDQDTKHIMDDLMNIGGHLFYDKIIKK